MASAVKLGGVIPAIVTPMDEKGNIDLALLKKQAEYLISCGVNGLFVCGGTGEGAYLTTDEKHDVMREIKRIPAVKNGSVFTCLAAINSNTRAAMAEIKALSSLKPDFFVATAPYYHAMTQKDLIAHYESIAQTASAPLIVYNIPSTTHNYIELDTVKTLSKLPNVAGVKDSSGNFINFSRGLFGERTQGFAWIQGEDYLCGPAMLCGGDGMVSGLSNARAEAYVALYRAALAGDTKTVMNCQAQINQLYGIIHAVGNGNAAIKAATEYYGRGARYMRTMSQTVTSEQYAAVSRVLAEYDKVYGA
ncbi:4-hydroxy-tetrahydrodipicolinate synthase [bioreactor metagenome]|uniref:4-hydroxy-tetrahydrodipicolinate synthase n=1 Tax=bioreactor metagenome TaxID=1076179 RepID=A0A644XTQ3_9ZZZZ